MNADSVRDKALQHFRSNEYAKASEASLDALRLYLNELSFATSPAQRNNIRSDIDRCIDIVKSSQQKNLASDIPQDAFVPIQAEMKFSDIAGMDNIKNVMRENFLEFRDLKDLPGIRQPKGMLLYGPPGNGKTILGKALAGEFGLKFYYVGCGDVLSKYYGESPRIIKELYETARKERSLIFFDEFEVLAQRKDAETHEASKKIINQLLIELDGAKNNENVFTIGATNALYLVEPALLRPGRMPPTYVPMPDKRTRASIVQTVTRGHDVDFEYVAHLTEGKTIGNVNYFFSSDDLIGLIGAASRIMRRKDKTKSKLTTDDVIEAYRDFMPSINEFDMKKYSDIQSFRSRMMA